MSLMVDLREDDGGSHFEVRSGQNEPVGSFRGEARATQRRDEELRVLAVELKRTEGGEWRISFL